MPGAARVDDSITHGLGMVSMMGGAVVGAVIGAAVIMTAPVSLTVGAMIVGGAVAGGALSMKQLVGGVSAIKDLPGPTTGKVMVGSPNVFINGKPAAVAQAHLCTPCTGSPCVHMQSPVPVMLAEGSALWQTGFEVVGMAALVGAGGMAAAAGVGAAALFGGVVGAGYSAFKGLGALGNAIGPGYADLLQGSAGVATLFAGTRLARGSRVNSTSASDTVQTPNTGKPSRPSFDEIYAKAPAAKEEIDAVADDIARSAGGRVAKAPIKSRARALEKIENDYEGDPTRIKDLARNTIVVRSNSIDSVANELEARGATVKRIDANSNPIGYSGVNATLPTKSGLTSEIQVNSPEMIYAKESEPVARSIIGDADYDAIAAKTGVPGGQGHALYEQYRQLPSDSPEASRLAEQSRAYYEAVRGPADGN